MNQPQTILENGTRIFTSTTLADSLVGVSVGHTYIESRKPNTRGQVVGVVPGCGGDMYWVQHFDRETVTAVYGWWEFELDTGQGVNRFDHEEVI